MHMYVVLKKGAYQCCYQVCYWQKGTHTVVRNNNDVHAPTGKHDTLKVTYNEFTEMLPAVNNTAYLKYNR